MENLEKDSLILNLIKDLQTKTYLGVTKKVIQSNTLGLTYTTEKYGNWTIPALELGKILKDWDYKSSVMYHFTGVFLNNEKKPVMVIITPEVLQAIADLHKELFPKLYESSLEKI